MKSLHMYSESVQKHLTGRLKFSKRGCCQESESEHFVMPILKGDRGNEVKYKHLSMTSTGCKTLEKIRNRKGDFLKTRNHVSERQHGFR